MEPIARPVRTLMRVISLSPGPSKKSEAPSGEIDMFRNVLQDRSVIVRVTWPFARSTSATMSPSRDQLESQPISWFAAYAARLWPGQVSHDEAAFTLGTRAIHSVV
ncbi:MAG: hypothetical protein KF745_06485 [Phycisphaeraceae bacterium]|nr:hypothetical protein [Phycisphaeraceae bacterium]